MKSKRSKRNKRRKGEKGENNQHDLRPLLCFQEFCGWSINISTHRRHGMGIILVLLFKFINIVGAALIYLLAALFGACDGLVTRYVRTAEGGRESTFIFHQMTNMVIQIPVGLIMIYLISPVLINPTLTLDY